MEGIVNFINSLGLQYVPGNTVGTVAVLLVCGIIIWGVVKSSKGRK